MTIDVSQNCQSSSRASNEFTRFQWINQWNSRLDWPIRQKSPLFTSRTCLTEAVQACQWTVAKTWFDWQHSETTPSANEIMCCVCTHYISQSNHVLQHASSIISLQMHRNSDISSVRLRWSYENGWGGRIIARVRLFTLLLETKASPDRNNHQQEKRTISFLEKVGLKWKVFNWVKCVGSFESVFVKYFTSKIHFENGLFDRWPIVFENFRTRLSSGEYVPCFSHSHSKKVVEPIAITRLSYVRLYVIFCYELSMFFLSRLVVCKLTRWRNVFHFHWDSS